MGSNFLGLIQLHWNSGCWIICFCIWELRQEMSCLMTKPTMWHVRQAKTQVSLGVRSVWSESSLGAHPLCWFCHEEAQFTQLLCLYKCYIIVYNVFYVILVAFSFMKLQNMGFKGYSACFFLYIFLNIHFYLLLISASKGCNIQLIKEGLYKTDPFTP